MAAALGGTAAWRQARRSIFTTITRWRFVVSGVKGWVQILLGGVGGPPIPSESGPRVGLPSR